MKLLKIIILFSILSIICHARNTVVTFNVRIQRVIKTFQLRTDCSSFYEIFNQQEMLRRRVAEGLFAEQIGSGDEAIEVNTVLGSYGHEGHSLIVLTEENETIFLTFDTEVYFYINSERQTIRMQERVACEFAEGSSWKDFQAGKDVKLKLTQEGRANFTKALSSRIQVEARKVIENLLERNYSEIELRALEIFPSDGDITIFTSKYGFLSLNGKNIQFSLVFEVD